MQVVPVIFPQTSASNTLIAGDRVSLSKASEVCFLVNIGTVTSGYSGSITVIACTAATSGSSSVLGTLRYRKMTTVDTWGAETSDTDILIDAAGEIVPADPVNALIEIRVLASDLRAISQTTDYEWVYVNIGAGGGSKYITCAAEAILFPLRYGPDIPVTVIA